MKMFVRIAAFLLATVGFAADATAQGADWDTPRATEIAAAVDTAPGAKRAERESMVEAGAFDRLGPADRKRAENVFNAQTVTALGSAPMNLDRIASLKRSGGWKLVFSRMKQEGLTRAKSVRQLLAGARKARGAKDKDDAAGKARLTVVTNGAGERIIVIRQTPSAARESVGPRGLDGSS